MSPEIAPKVASVSWLPDPLHALDLPGGNLALLLQLARDSRHGMVATCELLRAYCDVGRR